MGQRSSSPYHLAPILSHGTPLKQPGLQQPSSTEGLAIVLFIPEQYLNLIALFSDVSTPGLNLMKLWSQSVVKKTEVDQTVPEHQ